ncbi:hypothetical protein Tco_0146230 [Tanacetum coccineum]
MKPYVRMIVGDGKSDFMWYDKWDDNGPLVNFVTDRDLYNARLSKKTYVADMIKEGKWMWPEDWINKYPILNNINVPYLNDKKDSAMWVNNKDSPVLFSIRSVWMSLRVDYPEIKV